MNEKKERIILDVAYQPQVRTTRSTQRLMLDVLIALIPAAAVGIYQFGTHALLVMATSVTSAVFFEWLYRKLTKKTASIDDLSAVVTGLLLALTMPANCPAWIPVVGTFFAIVVVKQLYGGLGQNFINPAIAGRCFLHISFAGLMNNFSCANIGFDAMTGASPLAAIRAGTPYSYWDLFIGNTPGTIGEVSILCLLIGISYMIARNIITPRIPVTYIATFAIFMFIAGGFDFNYLILELLSGSIVFGACFMANDYVTSPVTHGGQVVYAVFLGVMTGVIRTFSPSAEGVSYAILFGNLLVPIIERYTIPTPFGKRGNKKV